MASARQLRRRMRRTRAGWSDAECRRVAEYYGYEFQRVARHGYLHRNDVIATQHPDTEIRKRYAYLLIPRGEVRRYVVDDLLDGIDVYLALTSERPEAEDE